MEQIINYVRPELLVVSVVLYFIGIGIKHTEAIADKWIPAILGLIGIVLSALYVCSTSSLTNASEICMAVFTAIVQGILVAGLSTYVNQVIKQAEKPE